MPLFCKKSDISSLPAKYGMFFDTSFILFKTDLGWV